MTKIPALPTSALIAPEGVNEMVAVVVAALTLLPRVISRPNMDPPVIMENLPLLVAAEIERIDCEEKSLEMPAATFAMAACPTVGVVKDVTVTLTYVNAG